MYHCPRRSRFFVPPGAVRVRENARGDAISAVWPTYPAPGAARPGSRLIHTDVSAVTPSGVRAAPPLIELGIRPGQEA